MMPEQRGLPPPVPRPRWRLGAQDREPPLGRDVDGLYLEAHFMTRSAALRAGTIFALLTLFFGAIGLSAYVPVPVRVRPRR
jgi:hypothetical protein